MKNILIKGSLVSLFLIFGWLTPIFAQKPNTVSKVDLNRYAGKWFEIARFPNRFQKQCVGKVTAEYSLQSNNRIKVVNKCEEKDGKVDVATGEAKIVDNQTNSKLKVRFAPKFLSFLPFIWGDYWVLDLGKNYDYVLVGSPDRDYLWILSRKPTLDDKIYQKLFEIAQKQGFEAERLVKTKH